MYHPTCPKCHSPQTIKHGGKRWKCKRPICGYTFTLKNPTTRDRVALEGYVLDRSTYERLGTRWDVHRSTAYRRVQRALMRRLSLLERTKRNISRCDGVCVLDGKMIHVRGQLFTLFVAWDRGLQQPIHFYFKEGGEKELWYWRLLLDLEKIGYVPKAFISDGILTLKEFLKEKYPDLPHQRCAVHVFLAARSRVIAGRGKIDDRTKDFIELLRHILWSDTRRIARQKVKKISGMKNLKTGERNALELIRSALVDCFVCRDERWQELHLPRSSNAIENVMGQIEARLKTRRGTKSEAALERLVNEILLRVSKQVITHS